MTLRNTHYVTRGEVAIVNQRRTLSPVSPYSACICNLAHGALNAVVVFLTIVHSAGRNLGSLKDDRCPHRRIHACVMMLQLFRAGLQIYNRHHISFTKFTLIVAPHDTIGGANWRSQRTKTPPQMHNN